MGTSVAVLLGLLLIAAFSIAWTVARGGPWIPSSPTMVRKMLQLADLQPGELLYDLGCGDGRILITAAREFGARAVGIEIDPLRYLWCQLRVTLLGLRDRVRIVYGDLYRADLSPADVVACYLLPGSLPELERKLLAELRPDARVVSNTFLFPGMTAAARDGKALLYIFSPEYTLRESLKRQLLSGKQP